MLPVAAALSARWLAVGKAVADLPSLPARNGLPAALAGGTLHPPAPAVCLLDGLPPRPLRGQGSLRAHECSLRLRRPLDRSGVEAARRHRSPGAGEDLSPTSSQHKGGTNAAVRAGLAGGGQPSGQKPALPPPQEPATPAGGPGRSAGGPRWA